MQLLRSGYSVERRLSRKNV